MTKRVTRKQVNTAGTDYTNAVATWGAHNMVAQRAHIKYMELTTAYEKQKAAKKNPVPIARGTKAARKSDVRIVHNKLLGGWYIVRGPHQTPLGGRFDSKAEARAHLNRVAFRKGNPAVKTPTKKQVAARKLFAKRAKSGFFLKKTPARKTARPSVRKKNPAFRRDDIISQLRGLANMTGEAYQLEVNDDGRATRYQVTHPGGGVVSLFLPAEEMRTWLHGAIRTATYMQNNKARLPR